MKKEISFYKIDNNTTEKEMTNRFGQHLIRVELDGKVYAVRILQHDGEKLDYNNNAEELMKLSKYIIDKTKGLKYD